MMSKLRGQIAIKTRKRVKAFFYGDAGTGKTTCAINFPKPYYIDTERGAEHAQYMNILQSNGGVVFQTRSFKDLFEEILTLSKERHEFETIVIDPITPIFSNLVDEYGKTYGTAHGKHFNEVNKAFERLLNLLLRIDMNVVITAHSKKEYGKDLEVLGHTYDGYKKLHYIFDLVIEAKTIGKKYIGVVKKSRISTIPANEEIDFDYKSIHHLYGKDILSIGSSVPLDDNGSLNKLRSLMHALDIKDEEIKLWCKRADAENIEDMTEDKVGMLISMLEARKQMTKEGGNHVEQD
jgi:hypothetical protein